MASFPYHDKDAKAHAKVLDEIRNNNIIAIEECKKFLAENFAALNITLAELQAYLDTEFDSVYELLDIINQRFYEGYQGFENRIVYLEDRRAAAVASGTSGNADRVTGGENAAIRWANVPALVTSDRYSPSVCILLNRLPEEEYKMWYYARHASLLCTINGAEAPHFLYNFDDPEDSRWESYDPITSWNITRRS